MNILPAYGRARNLYTGPVFEPHLEGVSMDPPEPKRLRSVVLAIENVGGWLRKYYSYSAAIDDTTWKEQLTEGDDVMT